MKSITVRLNDWEYEELRKLAYEERESVSGRAARLLGKVLQRGGEAVKTSIRAEAPDSAEEQYLRRMEAANKELAKRK
jgi:hypothetical protein